MSKRTRLEDRPTIIVPKRKMKPIDVLLETMDYFYNAARTLRREKGTYHPSTITAYKAAKASAEAAAPYCHARLQTTALVDKATAPMVFRLPNRIEDADKWEKLRGGHRLENGNDTEH